MKKLLLSMLCLLIAGFTTWAADVTISFNGATWEPSLPTAYNTTAPTTHTCGDNTVTVFNCKVQTSSGNSALLLTKNSGYIKLPAFSQKVASITFYSLVNASAKAVVNLYEGDGATSLGSATTTNPGVDNGYTIFIDEASQKENVEYKLMPNNTANAQISKIEVTYAVATNTVSTPIIEPETKDFSEAFTATISCGTEGASIYYTLDGTTPTTASTLYTDGVSIPAATTTLSAIAVKEGMDNSAVAKAVYTYIDPTAYQCANIAEWLTKASADLTHAYEITGEVTVSYNALSGSNQYTYVQDASGSLLIYQSTNSLTPGQTLTGLEGYYTSYAGLPEMKNSNLTSLTPGTGTAPEPAVTTVASITTNDISKYVKITSAEFNPTTKVITQNGSTIAVYYRFSSVTNPTETAKYDIEGFVSINNGTIQIFPTKYTFVSVASWSEAAATVTYNTAGNYTLPTLSNPDNVAVTYSSSDTTVATIDATGKVSVLKPGTTTIKATYGGDKEASYALTVNKITFTVTFSGLTDGTFTAKMGEENSYPTYTVEPAAESSYFTGVTYQSSDTDVATIAPDGTVTLNGVGQTAIRILNAANDYALAGNNAAYTLIVEVGEVDLKEPVITVLTSESVEVENGGTITESEAPVSISVTNPNDNCTMSVYVMKAPSLDEMDELEEYETVDDFSGKTWSVTDMPKDPGFYYVSAMVFNADYSKDSYAEFMFVIEGDAVKTYINPIVSFTDEEGNLISATSGAAPITFSIENQNPSDYNSSIYYFITTSDTDPAYTKSDSNVSAVIDVPGTYRYSAYIASYEGETLTGTSETITGTFTVKVAPLKDAIFMALDKEGNKVNMGDVVAEDMAPVTVTITNPNADSTMEISVANLSTGTSTDYSVSSSSYTLSFEKSGEHAIGVLIMKNEQDNYSEFYFTIDGEVEYSLTAPYVEFLNDDYDEVPSPATALPVNMTISHQNWIPGAEMVYTINGETTTTDEREVVIPLTEPGTITYSVYVKVGTKSISDTVSGTYEVTADAVKLAAPTITFSTPEGEIEPVTVTITNPNLGGIGTLFYSIGTSTWFEADGATVAFTLPNDGVYTVRAYVRNNNDESLSSDITVAEYTLDGIETVSFGTEGVKVIGGHIMAPQGTEVYSISGQRVNTLDRVAAGIYIVRLANGTTTKVIVK